MNIKIISKEDFSASNRSEKTSRTKILEPIVNEIKKTYAGKIIEITIAELSAGQIAYTGDTTRKNLEKNCNLLGKIAGNKTAVNGRKSPKYVTYKFDFSTEKPVEKPVSLKK